MEREDKHEIDIKRHYLHRNSEKNWNFCLSCEVPKILFFYQRKKNFFVDKNKIQNNWMTDYLFLKKSFHFFFVFCYLSKLLPHTIFYILFFYSVAISTIRAITTVLCFLLLRLVLYFIHSSYTLLLPWDFFCFFSHTWFTISTQVDEQTHSNQFLSCFFQFFQYIFINELRKKKINAMSRHRNIDKTRR